MVVHEMTFRLFMDILIRRTVSENGPCLFSGLPSGIQIPLALQG